MPKRRPTTCGSGLHPRSLDPRDEPVAIGNRSHGWVALFAALLTVANGVAAAEQPSIITPPASARDIFSRFAGVMDVLQKRYVSPSKLQETGPTTTALREYVRSLDRDADLLTPEETTVANAPLPDGVCDFGINLTISNDSPTVISALDGSTAQKARLFAGDQIIAVDDQPTRHLRLFDVRSRLRGAVGTVVRLHVLDVTGTERDIVFKRAPPSLQLTARLKFLGNGIAYDRLSEFTVAAVEKLRAEVDRAKAERTRGFILDLRNNAGGTFDATMGAAQLFLPAKTEIVSLSSSQPELRAKFVSDETAKAAMPMVVLVNGGTAAEAEVFAAALRDNKRARLVGSRTFGRGYQFSQFPLPDGSALFIPTAQYLPPSGTSFQAIGLTPDVVVQLPRETERALAGAGFGSFDWSRGRSKVLKDDAVLAKALDLLGR